jgi:hypothetical protein
VIETTGTDLDEDGPFPVPLVAKAPLGSLIYDPAVSGRRVNPDERRSSSSAGV